MKGENTKYLSLLLLSLLALSIVNITSAQVLPLIYVDPAEISYNPGESFTIDVNIADAVDLYSYQTKLRYNPDVLEPIFIEEGPFIKDQTTSPMGTMFSAIFGDNWVYAICVTVGKYPGVSGNGNLFNVTFNVIDPGACDLELYDSIMLNSSGAILPHDTADGHFYTTARADLVKKSAWPEHHHFDVSKDEDGNQTLHAKVKNLGPIDILIKASFDIVRDDTLVITVSSDEMLVAPDTEVELTADFGPLEPADAGKYYVSASAYCSWSGNYWHPGEKVKTFSFAVVP